jgi:hypothetical protein
MLSDQVLYYINIGTGILLSVNIIYGYFDKYAWEKKNKGIKFY